ncbi:heavy-metal-associated domain-containing protein, partial [Armatimonas sp.]|uniref:heavy-metal-associated domain-containing protein n=1 Tax=Armatimonas sp. TaxID=1872638 RepID=UPI00286C89CB
VPEIECGGCAPANYRARTKMVGKGAVQVNVEEKTVIVAHDPILVSVAAILTRLDHAGFPATLTEG